MSSPPVFEISDLDGVGFAGVSIAGSLDIVRLVEGVWVSSDPSVSVGLGFDFVGVSVAEFSG